eukprot:gene5873-1048_t
MLASAARQDLSDGTTMAFLSADKPGFRSAAPASCQVQTAVHPDRNDLVTTVECTPTADVGPVTGLAINVTISNLVWVNDGTLPAYSFNVAAGCFDSSGALHNGTGPCPFDTPYGHWATRSAIPYTKASNQTILSAVVTRALAGCSMSAVVTGTSTGAAANQLWSNSTIKVLFGQKCTILTALVTNHDLGAFVTDPGPVPAAVQHVLAVPLGYGDTVARDNAAFWAWFWAQSSVTLPSRPLLQELWFGALYVIGSAARPGRVAPGLYGPWVTQDNSAWHGDYTTDWNFQANFYGVNSVNHMELAQPFFAQTEAFRPLGRAGAQDVLAGAGNGSCWSTHSPNAIHYPAHLGPFGNCASMGYSPSADWGIRWDTPYIAMNYVRQWEYAMDAESQDSAFRFLNDTMAFFSCWLRAGPIPGKALGYQYDDVDTTTDENGFMGPSPLSEVAFLAKMSSTLLQLYKMKGLTAPQSYIDIDSHLPSLHLFRFKPKNGGCDMMSVIYGKQVELIGMNIYPLWPAEVIHHGSDPALQTLAANTAAQLDFNSIDRLSEIGSLVRSGRGAVCQSLVWDPARILDTIESVLRKPGGWGNLMSNMLTKAGIQMAGSLEGIASALLQSDEFIEVFPVWPAEEPASFNPLRAKGAFLVSAAWNNQTRRVDSPLTVESLQGVPCSIKNPWHLAGGNVTVMSTRSPDPVHVHWNLTAGIFTFSTIINVTYSVALVTW